MIFYFTGTGNSSYVAKQIAEKTGDKLINMAQNRHEKHSFQLVEGESVGFVFPVYYYTLNHIVSEYISNLTIEGNGYVYAIVTCGGSIGGTGGLLKEELEKRNITLNNVYSLQMPDNAVFYYNIVDEQQAQKELAVSEKNLQLIFEKIQNKESGSISSVGFPKALRKVAKLIGTTKKFYATNQCISCGKCEKNCPEQVIEIVDGKPQWVKKSCVLCSSCINRCPAKAIQYGKGTENRNRYVNPYD